ncbi:ABC transporter permease [Vitreimonas sp.]|uniref:ABC transporter permease n=1 Tax=Vitreimonas sp. TaxID=3069702 RepID=UPI002ED94F48
MARALDISWSRLAALFVKEAVQMRRDRLTFAIMVAVPILLVILFGYAINTDPRHLPAVVELREDGPLTRSFLASLRASSLVDFVEVTHDPEEGERMIRSGRATFLVVIPEGFERRLVRGERPQLLIAADASDPVAASGVIGAVERIAQTAFAPDFEGPLAFLAPAPPPYDIVIHRLYNPAGVTAFHIVPALLGVVLTMTMTMITSIALTRETERGTMENLLAMPVRPFEVMIGKTAPYVLVGAIQSLVVIAAGILLFGIPFTGSPSALALGVLLFVVTNLAVGYLISTAVRTQMQAMQATFFIFLPSMLLSGFMFPFRAMPAWAQALGECFPITHFLRIVREITLKGAGLADIGGDLVRLSIILIVVGAFALARFRRTLE